MALWEVGGWVGGRLRARYEGATWLVVVQALHNHSCSANCRHLPVDPSLVAVPVRTPAEHPLRLHSWRLRFYAASTMFQPSPEAADAHLRNVLAAAAGDEATADPPDLQELLAAAAAGEAAAGQPTAACCTWLPRCAQLLPSHLVPAAAAAAAAHALG